MTRPQNWPENHMHDYNKNWKCSCGQRLLTQVNPKTGWVDVRGFVTKHGTRVLFNNHENGEGRPQSDSFRAVTMEEQK